MQTLEIKIKEILKKKFFVQPKESSMNEPLLKLGLSAFDINELINHLEEEFEIVFENELDSNTVSLDLIYSTIQNQTNP